MTHPQSPGRTLRTRLAYCAQGSASPAPSSAKLALAPSVDKAAPKLATCKQGHSAANLPVKANTHKLAVQFVAAD
jgi:hypothetical protein